MWSINTHSIFVLCTDAVAAAVVVVPAVLDDAVVVDDAVVAGVVDAVATAAVVAG